MKVINRDDPSFRRMSSQIDRPPNILTVEGVLNSHK